MENITPSPVEQIEQEQISEIIGQPAIRPLEQISLRSGRIYTPGEVAKMFRVDPKTVTRWAAAGKLSSLRTPGGHRRFREEDILQALKSGEQK